MDKKYEILMGTNRVIDGHVLHRIRALKNFGDVRAGEIGGWIESEYNLSHEGSCFILNDACAYDDACIYENAHVHGNARVYEKACVYGNARVYDNAHVFGNARVLGNAHVYGIARVYEDARVYENAGIHDDANVYGIAHVCGDAYVCGNAHVYGNAYVEGKANIYKNARVSENMSISEKTGVTADLSKNLKENIRCQTGLGVFNNKVIAYKQVNKDLTSVYDSSFKYIVGEIAETEIKKEDLDKEKSCGTGLHFSNMNYWNENCDVERSTFLIAEIDLDDIVAVQRGKIRCKRAKILGTYEI